MGKYIKKFDTHSDYEDFIETEDFIKPNVSYCVDNVEVHYSSVSNSELIVRYNAASNPTQLYMYMNQQGAPFTILGADMFSKVEIDGTEVAVADLDTAQGQYQLSAGEHTVKYTLIDPTFIGIEMNEPRTITRLGAVFSQCSNIISVEIPNSVTNIGDAAFSQCSLTSVTIGNSVTSIGESAFQDCSSLTTVTIPNGVTSIGYRAFENCSGLISVIISDSVTSIGNQAFNNCTGLTSVTIGNGVTSIGNYAFASCSGLTSVTIGSGVTTIGYSAFNGCRSLTSITIPDSVTSIDQYTFADCNSLTSVTVEATTPPTLGSDAFYNTNNCYIYVPVGTSNTYKAASGWSDYSSRIHEIGEVGR